MVLYGYLVRFGVLLVIFGDRREWCENLGRKFENNKLCNKNLQVNFDISNLFYN